MRDAILIIGRKVYLMKELMDKRFMGYRGRFD
mgnify:CR=1 FL=1|jgi:hypothetical protein